MASHSSKTVIYAALARRAAGDPSQHAAARRDGPGVVRLNELVTMHFGPQDVLVALSMDFEAGMPAPGQCK